MRHRFITSLSKCDLSANAIGERRIGSVGDPRRTTTGDAGCAFGASTIPRDNSARETPRVRMASRRHRSRLCADRVRSPRRLLLRRSSEPSPRGLGAASLQLGGVGNDPRYTRPRPLRRFPFRGDNGATRCHRRRGEELDRLRVAWLNPEKASAAEIKKRTLTNLYNERPTWLANAHATLDAAVAGAYGWLPSVDEEEFLGRLLRLNLEREQAEVA